MSDTKVKTYTRADFSSDQSVRWCPGCGDYAILAQAQKVFPDLGVSKENFVFISGIGCSSRFPYYMNTFGFHTIHGRAPAIASGVKLSNPDLSVWVVTGDGDALSIGGNHTIHLLRRNLDINIMLFNNRIYGLTKGQYSPTSEIGKVTKSSPFGSLDRPFNPLTLALGAGATYVARTIDRETKHMLWLENGQPMVFGKEKNRGIRLDGNTPMIVEIGDKWSLDDVLVHNESDYVIASLLSNLTYQSDFPDPIGVLYAIDSPTYEELMMEQINNEIGKKGSTSVQDILNAGDTWVVE